MAKDLEFNIDFNNENQPSTEEQLEKINELAEEYKRRITDKTYESRRKLGLDVPSLEFDEISGMLSRDVSEKKVKIEEDINRQYEKALYDIDDYNMKTSELSAFYNKHHENASNDIETHEITLEEPEEKINDNSKKLCLMQSIKPNVAVPYIPIKHKVSKKKVALSVAKIAVISGLAFTGINALTNYVEDNKMVKEKIEFYKNNVYDETSKYEMKYIDTEFTNGDGETYTKEVPTPIHSHDISKMIEKTKEKYEDPILAFYLLYNNIDYTCKTNKNELNIFFTEFNKAYGTSYKDYYDFIYQNNFQNERELKKYIIYVVKEQKERLGR